MNKEYKFYTVVISSQNPFFRPDELELAAGRVVDMQLMQNPKYNNNDPIHVTLPGNIGIGSHKNKYYEHKVKIRRLVK